MHDKGDARKDVSKIEKRKRRTLRGELDIQRRGIIIPRTVAKTTSGLNKTYINSESTYRGKAINQGDQEKETRSNGENCVKRDTPGMYKTIINTERNESPPTKCEYQI